MSPARRGREGACLHHADGDSHLGASCHSFVARRPPDSTVSLKACRATPRGMLTLAASWDAGRNFASVGCMAAIHPAINER